MTFKFRKPYSHLPKEGVNPNAVVVFRSRPYSYGDNYDQIYQQLIIDLWLTVVTFKWIRKKPPTLSSKIYGKL